MSGYLLLLCLISVTAVPQNYDQVYQDFIKYTRQVQIIRDMLTSENCVDPIAHELQKREILGSNLRYNIELEVQRKLYRQLLDILIECKNAGARLKSEEMTTTTATRTASPDKTNPISSAKKTTTISTTTMPRTRPTTVTNTTPKPTDSTTTPTKPRPNTTPTPLHAMCLSATNLTESWRQDHKGSYILPKNGAYNCDTKEMIAAGRPWFRFSGAAGNRLMNKCVPYRSCGTFAALWSDDPMPTKVGIITEINVYGEYLGNCRYPAYTKKISVVRCSTSGNDYVYRYDGHDGCWYGFCGMSA